LGRYEADLETITISTPVDGIALAMASPARRPAERAGRMSRFVIGQRFFPFPAATLLDIIDSVGLTEPGASV